VDAYCRTGNSGPLGFWSYVFYLSKYYEWTDTILLSLKKKDLLPLHVYHHCITLWISWAQLRTDSVNFYEPLLSNCLIHTLMYYYYAKRTMGQTVWWKRYLTVAQLAQFVFDLTCSLPKQYLVLSGRCQGSSVACTFGQLGVVSFFFLFSDFYKKTYGNESPLSPHDDKKKSWWATKNWRKSPVISRTLDLFAVYILHHRVRMNTKKMKRKSLDKFMLIIHSHQSIILNLVPFLLLVSFSWMVLITRS